VFDHCSGEGGYGRHRRGNLTRGHELIFTATTRFNNACILFQHDIMNNIEKIPLDHTGKPLKEGMRDIVRPAICLRLDSMVCLVLTVWRADLDWRCVDQPHGSPWRSGKVRSMVWKHRLDAILTLCCVRVGTQTGVWAVL
jgi:hypothetical protein